MCYHKRCLYAHCNHNAWGPEIKPCDSQRAFNEGKLEYECDVMQTHPRHSIVIEKLCPSCEKKRRDTDNTIKKIRSIMSELNETIEKMEMDKKDVANSLELESEDEEGSEPVAAPGDEKKEKNLHDSDGQLAMLSTIEEE